LITEKSKRKLHWRDDEFLTRDQLRARWKVSLSELHNKEKAGVLKPYQFSYKVLRYKLSDILAIEEKAAKPTEQR
jgi:hypothetical protein